MPKRLTQEQVRSLLHYDPDDGVFTWRERPESDFCDVRTWRSWNSKFSGKPAGHIHKELGYLQLARDYGHRLAWLYMTGEYPNFEVDHKNGSRADNRWDNLRDLTKSHNSQNLHGPRNGKFLGVPLGVSYHDRLTSKPYAARISYAGRKKHLGYFSTAEEAYAVYLEEKRKHHPGCTI